MLPNHSIRNSITTETDNYSTVWNAYHHFYNRTIGITPGKTRRISHYNSLLQGKVAVQGGTKRFGQLRYTGESYGLRFGRRMCSRGFSFLGLSLRHYTSNMQILSNDRHIHLMPRQDILTTPSITQQFRQD